MSLDKKTFSKIDIWNIIGHALPRHNNCIFLPQFVYDMTFKRTP